MSRCGTFRETSQARWALVLWMLIALAFPESAQETASAETVSLRVSASGPGSTVTIDRGSADGVAIDDPIQLFPRNQPVVLGRVTRVDERSATVRLDIRGGPPPTGTRGEVSIPTTRIAPRKSVEPSVAPDVLDVGAHPPWQNEDREWTPGQPLLAEVNTIPPYDRAPAFSGRLYTIVDRTRTDDSERSDFFIRSGADLVYENLFGYGSRINIDLELNRRQTQLPDQDREDDLDLRFDRLSYVIGGTRHAPERLELGRFLQNGVPEFGVLDGIEYSRRIDNGDTFGVSVGFMPEPVDDFETLVDFQIASYYRLVADSSEKLVLTAAGQKTNHNGDADRNLFLAKVEYRPDDAWNYYGAAWIDYFDSDDETLSGLQLTRAIATANRRWEGGRSVSVAYTHYEFPEIQRNEFLPVTAEQLANDHLDRISVSGVRPVSDETSFNGALGAWTDEDESGGDGQIGVEMRGLLARDSDSAGTLFASRGEFSSVVGARLGYGQPFANGRWNVLYEASLHDNLGFDADSDNVVQHWLKASHDFRTVANWYINVSAQLRLWDDNAGWMVGAYLSKSL